MAVTVKMVAIFKILNKLQNFLNFWFFYILLLKNIFENTPILLSFLYKLSNFKENITTASKNLLERKLYYSQTNAFFSQESNSQFP